MKPDEILLLANHFLKQADLKSNMAKRIMFSLLPHLAPQTQVHATKGMVDFNALKQMIPGAKELLRYGTLACLDELIFSFSGQDITVKWAKKQKHNIDQLDYSKTLKIIIDLFKRGTWLPDAGGPTWIRIAETLAAIQNSLETYQEAKKGYDYQAQADALMEMTSYMNVLDGLAHNTGKIMERLISYEGSNDPEYRTKIDRLMDSKELQDPEDVLQEILPTLEQSDAPLTMKDWVSAARQRKHQYQGEQTQRQEAIRIIRLKKLLLQSLTDWAIPEMKQLIQSWRNLADNVLLQRIVANRHIFNNLNLIARSTMKMTDIPDAFRLKLFPKIRSVSILASLAELPEEQMTQSLETMGYPKVRQLIWDVLELIELLQALPGILAPSSS